MTDDSLERDQLNLWEKLNRLYGERRDGEDVPEDAEAPVNEPAAAADDLIQGPVDEPAVEPAADEPLSSSLAGGDGGAADEPVQSICADCRFDCDQPADRFVIANCRIASGAAEENRERMTEAKAAASKGAMGIEKINETCRRCRRSCKQRTAKLNMMLCLGFLPIDPDEERDG